MSARESYKGHTPLPWRLTEEKGGRRVIKGGSPETSVCIVESWTKRQDALLMESAPSLLAENARLRKALRNLVEQCQRSVDGADEPDEQHGDEIQTVLGSSAWKQARAALAQEGGVT